MKTLSVSVLAILLSTHAMAGSSSLIKKCSTDSRFLDGTATVPSTFEIFADAGSCRVKVTETLDDLTDSFEVRADVSEYKIRAGLSTLVDLDDADLDDEDLNSGERLIVQAMILTSDSQLSRLYSAGVDLDSVRSVKVYQLAKRAEIGQTILIEARDEAGKELGSFLGGGEVSACK